MRRGNGDLIESFGRLKHFGWMDLCVESSQQRKSIRNADPDLQATRGIERHRLSLPFRYRFAESFPRPTDIGEPLGVSTAGDISEDLSHVREVHKCPGAEEDAVGSLDVDLPVVRGDRYLRPVQGLD